jgi:hypothetical protein
MQIRLAILAVLLTVTQAPVPIPGQAANNPAGSGGNVQKQGEKGKPNGQSAAASLPQNRAGPSNPDAEKPSAEDASNSVTVRKLPTVSVGKDWADWSYWGFGGLLVIVGGSQVLFLYRTLKAIQTQAGHMERQTKALEDSVAAAQKSADAAKAQIQMMKSKERGRLRIEFGHIDLVNDPDPDNGYEVPFTLILDGATQVYITENSCFAAIRETEEVPADAQWWRGVGLPTTITPEQRIVKGTATILTSEKPWAEPLFDLDEARVSLVREEKLHVFVRAVIAYEDLFGGKWEARFNKKWEYYWTFGTNTIDLSNGYWTSIGDNGEYPQSEEN